MLGLQPPAGGQGRGAQLQGQDQIFHGAEPGAGEEQVELEECGPRTTFL